LTGASISISSSRIGLSLGDHRKRFEAAPARLAARTHKVAYPILRFTDLVRKSCSKDATSPPSKSPRRSIRAGKR